MNLPPTARLGLLGLTLALSACSALEGDKIDYKSASKGSTLEVPPDLTRMGTDDRTKNYIARRTAQGLTKPEIIRCLKRYVAREVFLALTSASAEKRPAKAA